MTNDTGLFARSRETVRSTFAKGMGVEPDAFETSALTIVDRPVATPWYTAMAATFGNGTVIAVDPAYRELVEQRQPAPHYRVHYPEFLYTLVEEGARRGETLAASSPGVLWALGSLPAEPTGRDGLELRTVDADWMATEMPNRRFENGIGLPGVAGRDFRNRFASVLFDAGGEPVAVAGAFDNFGLLEIGVDVVREHRGNGLGPLVVAAVTREIVAAGDTPFYGCAATNIRSQHTALACGFIPVASDAFVFPSEPGG